MRKKKKEINSDHRSSFSDKFDNNESIVSDVETEKNSLQDNSSQENSLNQTKINNVDLNNSDNYNPDNNKDDNSR